MDLIDEPGVAIRKKLKGRLGRPPKVKVDYGVCGLKIKEKNDEVMERKFIGESHKGTGRCRKNVKG